MSKLPCFVLIYYDFATIKASLDFLLNHKDCLDLIVIENPSEYTETSIKSYLQDLVASRAITGYYLFDHNISNNAFEVVLDTNRIDTDSAAYVLVTDGDLVVDNDDWLTEEIAILENNPDVGVCTVRLNLDNLPFHVFPDAHEWLSPIVEHDDYGEVVDHTGVYLVLMRSNEFVQFLEYRMQRRLRFKDSVLKEFCTEVLGKKWAVTKRSQARHLTWDTYHDVDNPYTKIKQMQPLEKLWQHHRYSGFTLFQLDSKTRHVPMSKIIAGHVMAMQENVAIIKRRTVKTLAQALPTNIKSKIPPRVKQWIVH
ncbi:MAG: hypothetical protein KDI55_15510 [Anaerolineae bacterium]|nr:hypothetical protein [Anaerolineae bacterium]